MRGKLIWLTLGVLLAAALVAAAARLLWAQSNHSVYRKSVAL